MDFNTSPRADVHQGQTSRSEPQPNAAGASKRRIDAIARSEQASKVPRAESYGTREPRDPSGSELLQSMQPRVSPPASRLLSPAMTEQQDPSDAVVHDQLVPSHEVSSGHQEDNEAHEPGSSALLHELDFDFLLDGNDGPFGDDVGHIDDTLGAENTLL